MPSAALSPAPKNATPTYNKSTVTAITSASLNRPLSSVSPIAINRAPTASRTPTSLVPVSASLAITQSPLTPKPTNSTVSTSRVVPSSTSQQVFTSFAGNGKETGVYMVQFATPQPRTNVSSANSPKKDVPKTSAVTAPVIDLTQGQRDSPPLSQALSISSTPIAFSPSNIVSRTVSPTMVAPKRVVTAIPTVLPITTTPAVGASTPPIGHFLGRTAVTTSQQQVLRELVSDLFYFKMSSFSRLVTYFRLPQLRFNNLSPDYKQWTLSHFFIFLMASI